MRNLKINIPEGYEIDKEQSTFENIVFKPVVKSLPKTWEELDIIDGCFVNSASSDVRELINEKTTRTNRNIFATKEQAEASVALAQLSQLMQVYNDGWVPNWINGDWKYVIYFISDNVTVSYFVENRKFLSFKTPEIRDEFLKNFKDLIIIAKPLL